MLSALKLSAVAAALALLGSAAVAGDAPAAYYPSLGYGQSDGIYEVAPGGYVDEPAYANGPGDEEPGYGRDYGPPPGYGGEPRHGPHGPCCGGPPPPPCHCATPHPGPPIVYGGGEHRYAERGFEGEHVYGEVRRDEYDYDSGWRFRRIPLGPEGCPYAHMPMPHPVCGHIERERFEESERVPDTFFADTGGVGPAEFFGGGGGGGGVVIGGGASAGSFAFASASARASASIGIRIGAHGGGHGGGHMMHGCGCKR